MSQSTVSLAVLMTAAMTASAQSPFSSKDHWRFTAGDWQLAEGVLTQTETTIIPHAYYSARPYADCTVAVRFRAHDDGKGVKAAGLILRSQDSVSGYSVHYDTKNDQIILTRRQFGARRVELARQRRVVMDAGTWYTADTSVIGGTITVRLDGKTVMEVADAEPLAAGIPGLYTSQGKIDFSDFSVDGTPSELSTPWRIRMTYDVPEEQAIATIDWVKPICKQPGRYIGWPTVCRRADNELLVVFSGDRSQHVCPWGKVQLVRSSDDGETWSKPETICNTPLDDRDAGIIETVEGTLVVNWFTSLAFAQASYGGWLKRLESPEILMEWQRHADKLTPEIRGRWLGYWTRRSTDGGKTWETPVKHFGNAPHGGIRLKDGRLLFVGKRSVDGCTELIVEESRDDARSWQQIGTVPQNPEDDRNQYYEPHVVETGGGRLVAMFRYHFFEKGSRKRREDKSMLRQSESSDGGKTWATCHTTRMQGYPPHLIALKDDALLCVYGRRRPPFGEYACVSRDGGATWDIENEVRLAAATSGDLGYPASTEMADGSILTVYYQIAQQGERTCLMATRWRLK